MREPVFTGACTAIVTPFDQSGAIDYGCFGRLIDQQLDHGVDAICVCGTTGESATLSIRAVSYTHLKSLQVIPRKIGTDEHQSDHPGQRVFCPDRFQRMRENDPVENAQQAQPH